MMRESLRTLRARLWRWLWPLRSKLGCQVGSAFPDFALLDTGGRLHRLVRERERDLTVLWFTNFCPDCLSQQPVLEELGGEARVLAVSILPFSDETPRVVARTCAFPVLLDPEDIVTRRLSLPHPPGTCPLKNLFVVDGRGRILFAHHLSALGPDGFRKAWRDLVEGRRREKGQIPPGGDCARRP